MEEMSGESWNSSSILHTSAGVYSSVVGILTLCVQGPGFIAYQCRNKNLTFQSDTERNLRLERWLVVEKENRNLAYLSSVA